MLYAERDENGNLTAIRNTPENTDGKELSDEEVVAFLTTAGDESAYRNALSMLDSGLVRVIDDLIELLVSKNIIMFTDLPEDARKKIGERKRIRQEMQGTNDLMVDDII